MEGRLEKILDIKLPMEIGAPVIIGIPNEEELVAAGASGVRGTV